MLEKSAHKLIQSYVLESYFVSTVFRRASTPEELWYYETIVWEWDKNTRKCGKMIDMDDSGSLPKDAIFQHAEICCRLAEQQATNKSWHPPQDGTLA